MTKFELEDDWEILDTGTVINYEYNKPITLFIVENDGTKMKLRFVLNKDAEIEKDQVHFSEYKKDTLLIAIKFKQFLLNFGTLQPSRIGTYNGKDVYFNFRVSINSEDDCAQLTYTWYLKKELKP
ncbi:MAG: hypothetical protein DCF13_01915 [Flavobacteriaceae bacterium]|nr:MAG: hypothetical protein DCF13_01915 [Flavobacteriaceae bacterium]